MEKYSKISKDDVYKLIIKIDIDFMNMGFNVINVVNMASALETSRYQIKKYIDVLLDDGLVELKMEVFSNEEEPFPPYWGYGLTDKGRQTQIFKELEEEQEKFYDEMFPGTDVIPWNED